MLPNCLQVGANSAQRPDRTSPAGWPSKRECVQRAKEAWRESTKVLERWGLEAVQTAHRIGCGIGTPVRFRHSPGPVPKP
jgi:hypothetical protein